MNLFPKPAWTDNELRTQAPEFIRGHKRSIFSTLPPVTVLAVGAWFCAGAMRWVLLAFAVLGVLVWLLDVWLILCVRRAYRSLRTREDNTNADA